MDFELNKYDLFNAPQYVDFNEFLKNDGFGNDNADDFFRHHREEDDFFPNDNLSPTAQLLQDSVFSSPPEATPVVKEITQPSQVQNSKGNSVIQASPVQIQAAKSNPMSCVNQNYVEIDYEEELRLAEEATAKANKAETEDIKGMKIKAKLAETLRALEQAEIQQLQSLKDTHSTVLHSQVDRQMENLKIVNPFAVEALHTQQLVEQCKVADSFAAEPSAGPTMEAVKHKVTFATHEASAGDNEEDCVKPIEVVDIGEKDPKYLGDTGLNSCPINALEQESKNQFNVPIKRYAIPICKKSTLKVTIPQPFKFSETRPRKTHNQETNMEQFKFKAKPAPLKILKGETAPVVAAPPRVTQPKEIHFASEDRIRERNLKLRKSAQAPSILLEKERKPKSGISASRSTIGSASGSVEKVDASVASNSSRRSRTPSKTAQSNIRPRSLSSDRSMPTHVQPFSFEERDKEILRKKQEKIHNAIKDDMKYKEFHAHPVPKFPKRLPPKNPAPVTAVKPFRFKCDERGMSYQQEFQRKLKEETESLKQQAEFIAQPNTVIYKKPFEPEKLNMPVQPLDIVLHTDLRAPERHRFDHMIKEKEAELEEIRRKEQIMKEEQEKQVSSTLRQMCVHKAKPAPKNRIFELKTTERQLTEPKSPAFELLPSQRRMKCTENKENVE